MKIDYFADTDTLYIQLSENKSSESEEIVQDFVLDFDTSKQVVGIEIEHASKVVDLNKLESDIPTKNKLGA